MEFYFHLSLVSDNTKTGPIPVSTTSKNSCDLRCPLMDHGCFGDNFPLSLHWDKVSSGERGMSLEEFCERIADLPDGQLWRHNQVGDLPGNRFTGLLHAAKVRRIVYANQGKKGFTYCHYDPTKPQNARILKWANENGFTVNLSANTLPQADAYKDLAIAPVTVVLPIQQKTNVKTPKGNLVVVCPAETHDGVTCESCGLCAWKDRQVIIGFPAHGIRKKQAELVSIGGN
jgi:hypothetical protein